MRDQNRLLSLSPYGQPAAEAAFQGFRWMLDSGDEKLRFLWDRMLVSTRPDPSDAGMAYFLATGYEDTDPAKLRMLLRDHHMPPPITVRPQIRMEAENFRDLGQYEVEDRNDSNTSHRLSVRPKGAGDLAAIRARFDEPYSAARERYDVELRYFDEKDRTGRVALAINGVVQGEPQQTLG